MTVRNTLYRIQENLGIGRKQELVVWAVRNGLVDDVVVGNDPRRVWDQGDPAALFGGRFSHEHVAPGPVVQGPGISDGSSNVQTPLCHRLPRLPRPR